MIIEDLSAAPHLGFGLMRLPVLDADDKTRIDYEQLSHMVDAFAVNVMGVTGDLADRERVALEGIEALEDWTRKMGLPLTWAEVGLADADFERLAKRACGHHADGRVGGLERLGWEQVLEIYQMAL